MLMIEITDRAAAEIKSLLKAEGSEYTLRIYIIGEPAGEPEYGLAFSTATNAEVTILENNGVKLVIANDVLDTITDGSIDFIVDENGKNFIIQSSSSNNSECAECDICEDCD
jgi:Fe-S cluster assembly iron-binding protein IscA